MLFFGVRNETSRLLSSTTKAPSLITAKPLDALSSAETSAGASWLCCSQHRLGLSISCFPTDGGSCIGQNRGKKLSLLRDTCLETSSGSEGKSICFRHLCMFSPAGLKCPRERQTVMERGPFPHLARPDGTSPTGSSISRLSKGAGFPASIKHWAYPCL